MKDVNTSNSIRFLLKNILRGNILHNSPVLLGDAFDNRTQNEAWIVAGGIQNLFSNKDISVSLKLTTAAS